MAYTCEIKEVPLQHTVCSRTRTSVSNLPQLMGEVYGQIMTFLAQSGETAVGAPYSAYYNMDMEDLDVEIGIPVGKPLNPQGELKSGEMPAGRYAACLHTGPYNEVESAYRELTAWMESKGHEPTGVAYEIYLNDLAETPPEQLLTEVLFPIKA
jgi:effector-binding domain-containing protein